MKTALTIISALLISLAAFSQAPETGFPADWTHYANFNGVNVEYKYQECTTGTAKNQVLVLFRFTNTTADSRSLTWTTKHFRDGDCFNCVNIDSYEYAHEISLAPSEVIEADMQNLEDKDLYMFSHFIVLAKGMPSSKLTGFEFTNVNADKL
jgi:hypothetical protein